MPSGLRGYVFALSNADLALKWAMLQSRSSSSQSSSRTASLGPGVSSVAIVATTLEIQCLLNSLASSKTCTNSWSVVGSHPPLTLTKIRGMLDGLASWLNLAESPEWVERALDRVEWTDVLDLFDCPDRPDVPMALDHLEELDLMLPPLRELEEMEEDGEGPLETMLMVFAGLAQALSLGFLSSGWSSSARPACSIGSLPGVAETTFSRSGDTPIPSVAEGIPRGFAGDTKTAAPLAIAECGRGKPDWKLPWLFGLTCGERSFLP